MPDDILTKEARERDLAICRAATQQWRQGRHVGEPKAICSASSPLDSLLSLDKDGMAVFLKEEDAEAAVACVNRLPVYVKNVDRTERRIESLESWLSKSEASLAKTKSRDQRLVLVERVATLRDVINLLRGT